MRKDKLITGQIYHILNKSIEGYKIFNNIKDYRRFLELIRYYNRKDVPYRYSQYISLVENKIIEQINYSKIDDKLVEIICYCIMPTHFHLVVKMLEPNGITVLLRKISDGYAKYFNLLHKRSGHLWVGKFKNALIKNDIQLLHLTRYVHLNPISSGLTDKPEKWEFSSYNEYLDKDNTINKLCKYDILNIDINKYKGFVESRRSYQRNLSIIKKIVID